MLFEVSMEERLSLLVLPSDLVDPADRLDAVGLRVPTWTHYWAAEPRPNACELLVGFTDDGLPMVWDERERAGRIRHHFRLDMGAPEHRDRVLRWMAPRVRIRLGEHAPKWFHAGHGTWCLQAVDPDGIERTRHWSTARRPESPQEEEPGGLVIPELHAVDPADRRKVVGGCLYINARALAVVAVLRG